MTKKILFTLLCVAVVCDAQMITGRLTTSMYGWQGRDSALAKATYVRAYENVQLNFTQQQYSFNTNFQVSNDFGSTINTDPELKLSSLVVRVRNIADLADVAAGRQYVYAGVGNGMIDGGLVKVLFWERRIGLTLYGGYNVIHSRNINLAYNLNDNSLSGAQLTVAPVENATIGLSVMNKILKPAPYKATRVDSLFNPYVIIIKRTPAEEQLASLDARYEMTKELSIYGRADYDMNFERLSRIQLFSRYAVLPTLGITAEYMMREPRLAYNSIFSVFNYSSTDEIEAGIEYEAMSRLHTYARYAYVKYSDDNSQRLTVGGSYEFLTVSYNQNFGYAGDLSGISVQAVYPVWEQTVIPSVGIGYASYKLEKNAPQQSVMNLSLGTTYRPAASLSSDLQLQWINNPLYKNDVRMFLKVNYWFSSKADWF
jgi:hypothetical protein